VTRNTWQRRALALASVPLLAVPSAMGVYGWLAPESGPIAAGSAAVGFEALYVGVNVLILRSPELRRYARNVSMGAVATAVIFNSLYHYGAKVEQAYTGAPFAWLPFLLALLASLPLAGLAYSVSVLLHRLSEDEAEQPEGVNTPPEAAPLWAGPVLQATTWPRVEVYPAPVKVHAPMRADGFTAPQSAPVAPAAPDNAADAHQETIALHLSCPNCGAPLDRARWLAARRWGRCASCKPGQARPVTID
jgi:hypothetical protein